MTDKRLVITQILSEVTGPSDAERIYRHDVAVYPCINVADAYRTVQLFKVKNTPQQCEFDSDRAYYKAVVPKY